MLSAKNPKLVLQLQNLSSDAKFSLERTDVLQEGKQILSWGLVPMGGERV
jgi:hypothetical protein